MLLWDTLHPLVKQGPMQGFVLDMQETYEEPTKGLALQIPKRFLTSPVKLPYFLLAMFGWYLASLGLHWRHLGNIGDVW